MRVSKRQLDEWRSAGMVVNESVPPAKEIAAAPKKPADTAPASKRKWRFDIERDWDGYIKNVVAVEL